MSVRTTAQGRKTGNSAVFQSVILKSGNGECQSPGDSKDLAGTEDMAGVKGTTGVEKGAEEGAGATINVVRIEGADQGVYGGVVSRILL